MSTKNPQQAIDNKFNEAVSTDIEGGGEEDLDSFLEESFKGATNNEGVAEYDEDLGYVIDEAEEADTSAEEEPQPEPEPEDEPEQPEEEEDEPEEAEPEDEPEETEETEEPEEDEQPEEEEDDEPIYDAARDYEGEDVPPTIYKDRMSLNHGAVAKVSYFNTLKNRLKEAGTDLGALSLPDKVAGDPGNLTQYSDIEQVMSLPDEEAKEFIKQMDVLLQNMKNKAERFEGLKEQEEKKQQVSQAYIDAQQEAKVATKLLDIEVKPEMTNREIIDQAYKKLEEFEDNEEQLEDLGQKKFLAKLRDLEDAVFAIEDFAKVAAEHEQIKSQEKPDKVTPQQIESAFKEFMNDQPGLDMVKNNRIEMQKSLIQTSIRKGWPVQTPRDWLGNYQKFMKIVNANRAQKGLEKLKDETTKNTKNNSRKNGQEGKSSGRAKKYADKKPVATNSVSYSNRTGNAQVDKIDQEIDQLAAELSQGRDAGDNEFQW